MQHSASHVGLTDGGAPMERVPPYWPPKVCQAPNRDRRLNAHLDCAGPAAVPAHAGVNFASSSKMWAIVPASCTLNYPR